ncbi:MAG TPA: PsbP-related protein [Egibacteraceae bacterium]|nr:PsbP-related protein [Egibacteraceae bacterium]
MRRTVVLFVGAFAAGLLVVVAAMAGERFVGDSPSADDGPTGFTEFRDEEAGFAISYPEGWQRVPTGDPQVRLLVTRDRLSSILVRVAELDVEVTAEDLPAIRSFTDGIVQQGQDVEVRADPTQVRISGLPGISYLYTFQDSATDQEGVHLHYFLFDDATMYTMVMQALPTEAFAELAPTFDAVADSFEVPAPS